jgi:D-tyrosyl-tRNA(Tyr) deacylase
MQVVAGSFDFSFITPNAPTAHAHDSRKKPTATTTIMASETIDVLARHNAKLPKHHLTTPGSKQ